MFQVLKLFEEIEKAGPDRARVIEELLVEAEQATKILAGLKRLITPGSPVALSHSTGDPQPGKSTPRLVVKRSGKGSNSGPRKPSGAMLKRLAIGKVAMATGKVRIAEAIEAANCPSGSVFYYLTHEWFRKIETGLYELTLIGRTAVEQSQSSP